MLKSSKTSAGYILPLEPVRNHIHFSLDIMQTSSHWRHGKHSQGDVPIAWQLCECLSVQLSPLEIDRYLGFTNISVSAKMADIIGLNKS